MHQHLSILVVMAIVGAGVVTGLLFAFSNFVMRALGDLPAQHGMFAMQRINETILNPVFLALFFGTPMLCAAIVLVTFNDLDAPGHPYLLAGSLAYLIGPLGITVFCNVPLNNGLARTPAAEAEEAWPDYRRRWQRWNHIRSYLGIVSILLLAVGLSGI